MNWDNRERTTIALDRASRFVRISWPAGPETSSTEITPNTVWVYDVEQDAVWPMTYGGIEANKYGVMTDISSTTTYAGSTGLSYDDIPALPSYASFRFRTGRTRPVFGTTSGFVFQHTTDDTRREQLTSTSTTEVKTEPAYTYETPELDFGIPSSLKRTDKIHLSFVRQSSDDPTDIQVRFQSGGQTSTRSIAQNINNQAGSAAVGKILTNYATGRVAGRRIGFKISGAAPVQIHSMQLDYFNFGIQGTRD